ncbi:MAG: hypothetical protein B7Z36_02230 [Novosphingobium sp. 12-63-9]|nr:MAG: hypothetical protein B7Z36_02230 [Novosphingobium sp. 12-63-9]
MSDAKQLSDARALRTEAWAQVRGDVERLRDGLDDKSIGQRIKERATDEVVDAIDTARDVAGENKTVIGLTVAALVGWLFRRPIGELVQDMLDR